MAEQTARNWSSGDIVTAANLSSIERGVSAVAEEYTPTTWANGNTVTAAALNNIEQGIVNAGGGSSDFSTANVTITKAEGKIVIWKFPTIISDRLVVDKYFQQELTETHPVALYKGALEINIGTDYFSIISGNVTEDDGVFTITGDCSLQYIGF